MIPLQLPQKPIGGGPGGTWAGSAGVGGFLIAVLSCISAAVAGPPPDLVSSSTNRLDLDVDSQIDFEIV